MTQEHHFCSLGILSLATTTSVEQLPEEVTKTLADIIREHYPDRTHLDEHDARVIILFNDHPDTTFDDVERVFEKAEVAWDERV